MKFSKPLKPPTVSREPEIEHFAVSQRMLREICKGMDISSLPEEIRGFLEGSSSSTVVSMSAVDQLGSLIPNPKLPEKQAEQLVVQPAQGHEAGYPTLTQSDPLQLTLPCQPQTIQCTAQLVNPAQAEGTSTIPVTGHHPKDNASFIPNTAGEKPQRIPSPIRILKHRLPQTDTSDDVDLHSPCDAIPEKSEQTLPQQVLGGQKKNEAKVQIPREKPRVGAATREDKGKKIIENNKQAQRPKKGAPILIPPKSVLFKKLAQQRGMGGVKQNKSKQAAQRAAEIIKSPDGFYEVAVQYGLCKDLADGIGLKPNEVTEILSMDNQQRKEDPLQATGHKDMELDEEGLELDFESDEDLLSDEEPAQA